MDSNKIFSDFKLIIKQNLQEIRGESIVSGYLINTSSTAYAKSRKNPPLAMISIGKAAISMAKGAAKSIGEPPLKSLIITKYQHDDGTLTLPNSQIIESAHPVPDENSIQAGEALIDLCGWIEQQTDDEGWILCLISGGSSSLVEVLKDGISLEYLREINKNLLSSGKDIATMNRKRKEISLIKNGGLANLLPRIPVIALYLSDVPGNDPAVIGSGLLANGKDNTQHHILADNLYAKNKAEEIAAGLGYKTSRHSELLEGRVEDTADMLFSQMQEEPGKLHIWGGESLVNLPRNAGLGGRNQHLSLLMAKHIKEKAEGKKYIFASIGTDGSDGFTDYAGAIVDNKIAESIDNLDEAIIGANSTPALKKVGSLIKTGASGSNLMDLMLGLCF